MYQYNGSFEWRCFFIIQEDNSSKQERRPNLARKLIEDEQGER